MAEVAGRALSALDRLVNVRFQEFAFQTGMAGIADRIRPAGQDVFGAGTMRVMAAGAHILGKRAVLGFILGRAGAHIGVAVEAKRPFRFVDQALVGSRMGRMAGETAVFAFHRSMREPGRLAGVFMTIETEVVAGCDQQGFLFRGMWVMTGKTFARLEGVVLNSLPSLHGRVIMTTQAEFCDGSIQSERLLACCCVVAGVAFCFGHRIMQTAFQQVGIVRTVRVMTGGAGRRSDRVVAVRLFKT